jgi:glutaconyl-CoA/methylmalonyl-CoA decarboxylase subunit gamma
MKQLKIRVDGKEYMVEVEEIVEGNDVQVSTSPAARNQQTTAERQPKKPEVKQTKAEEKPALPQSTAEGEEINAPMPGKVLKINVSEGDSVNEGDTVLILEAMKMENEIVANTSGKVKKLSVSVNDMVETDDTLLIIG